MKLSHVIAPALAAILATACAACSHETSAPDRAAQAEADKHHAQDEAYDARLNAAKARADAQDAARAQYEADEKARFAAEAAAQAEHDAQIQNGTGVAEPQPVNAGVAVAPNASLGVAFAVSSSDLTGDEKARLDDIADRLRAHPTHRIVIEGYSDDIHADTADSRLSRRRADCVAHYLEKKGISSDRITVRTGTRNAVRYDDHRGYNRGVEFVID
jgi:outer membrane protein OmpA-like peptidoglycan-associated protein